MAEKIVLETEIKTGNSTNSVKGLKTELRELTKQLGTLEQGSDAFNQVAQRAGHLKEQIRGVNDAIDDADPEKKFGPFARTVSGLAGGFAAAQGAMALFGVESQELEKTLVKVQGAMALSQGLNTLLEFKNDFADLGAKIIPMVTKAFSTLKGAILSTGIGALVIALGIAINEIIKYNEAIDEEANAQERLNEELKKSKDLMEGVATESERKRNAVKGGLDDLKREKELLEAKGATEKEIFEKGQEIANAELRNLKIRKYSGLDVSKEIADKENQIKANQLAFEKSIEDKREDEAKKAADKRKERLKANQKSNDEYAKLADEKFKADMYAQIEAEKELSRLTEEFSRKEFEDSMARYDAEQAAMKAAMELDKAKTNAQLSNLALIADTMSGFIALAGEQTAAGKALAVAQTTIDTYVSAVRAYKSALEVPVIGTYLAPVAAASAVAAGLANVRRIMSVQVPGGNGGGGSVPSAPNMSIPRMTATGNEVSGAGAISLSSQPNNKVYVVESDIRRVQNKVEVIENNARIG